MPEMKQYDASQLVMSNYDNIIDNDSAISLSALTEQFQFRASFLPLS